MVVYIYLQSEIYICLSFIYPSSCLYVCIYEVTPHFSFDFSLPTEIQLYSALLSWHLFSPNHLFSFAPYFPTPSPLFITFNFSHEPSTQSKSTLFYSMRLSSSLLYATVLITTLRYCHHHYNTLTCCPAEFRPAVVTAFSRQHHNIFNLGEEFMRLDRQINRSN